MIITKLGHCCMVIKEVGLTILTDPGSYTVEAQRELTGIDLIVITHEHSDHYHLESLQAILKNNPKANVITNTAVGTLLAAASVSYNLLEQGRVATVKGITIQGFGNDHAPMYPPLILPVQNTGYFFANRFFYPGDAFFNPGKPVEILALPVVAPWMKLWEALDYAKVVKPNVTFPVHDGTLGKPGPFHNAPKEVLTPAGIKFVVPELGKEMEL